MKQYQREEWQRMVAQAKAWSESACPLIEDETILAIEEALCSMWSLIDYIAKDYTELSYEKIKVQRDDYVRMAQELLKELEEE